MFEIVFCWDILAWKEGAWNKENYRREVVWNNDIQAISRWEGNLGSINEKKIQK